MVLCSEVSEAAVSSVTVARRDVRVVSSPARVCRSVTADWN